MSMYDDLKNDNIIAIYECQLYEEEQEILSEKTNDELLDSAIEIGEALDEYEHFPAYSVALQLKNKGRIPTEKQRQAFINCMAYYRMNKKYPGYS